MRRGLTHGGHASEGRVLAGQTARVRAWVALPPAECLTLGRTRAIVDERERVVLVSVEWYENPAVPGPCSPAMATARMVPVRGLTAGTWTVRAHGSAATLTLTVDACTSGCACRDPLDSPAGTPCALDCECAPGLDCIMGAGHGAGRTCERSCGDDDDCPPGDVCTDMDPGPQRVCRTARTDECASAADCGPGESCECLACDRPSFCAPAMRPWGGDCCDSDDCDPGQRCVEYWGEAGLPLRACLVPCRGDVSCPVGSRCGEAADGPVGVCFWLEDR